VDGVWHSGKMAGETLAMCEVDRLGAPKTTNKIAHNASLYLTRQMILAGFSIVHFG